MPESNETIAGANSRRSPDLPDDPASLNTAVTLTAARSSLRRMLRLPDVMFTTGLSRSSIYALIKAGKFPAPVQLSPRTVGWPEDEIADWETARMLASRVRRAAGWRV